MDLSQITYINLDTKAKRKSLREIRLTGASVMEGCTLSCLKSGCVEYYEKYMYASCARRNLC